MIRLDALFAEQASATPDAPAILFQGATLTYGDLFEWVERLAADLAGFGVGPGVLVGLCVARTPTTIALPLAILKAGGAYLPLDHRYPAERLALLLSDSGATLLVTDRASAAWDAFRGSILQPRDGRLARQTRGVPARATGPRELAYVIYTSGSTGPPKGVMLGHGATHLVSWAREAYSAPERSCVAATTSLSFDPSIFEIFVPLCTGGTVLLKAGVLEPFRPDERPTLLDTVPSVLRELVRARAIPESVRVLNVGGEPLPASLVHETYRAHPGLTIHNHYGPTEATTCATVAVLPRDLAGEPPLGQAVRGAEILLLSREGAPCEDGEVGEIHIGGPGLALGYLNDPELTAARFPLRPSGRVYRTGDLAVRADGALHFAGRVDRQVKIRGFRLEPAEIEAALLRQPDVQRALVVARQAPAGAQLVAYVESEAAPSPADIRRRLATALPDHMVPAHVVVLRAFPQLVSGKIDSAALPEPGHGRAGGALQKASRVERAIIHVFEEVLGQAGVGPEDSFFDLGGDSLASVRTALRLEEVLAREIPAGLLHQAPTARALGAALKRSRQQAERHLSLLQPGDGGPTLFCVADLFGQPFNYLALARELGPERAVWGLSPGPLQAAFTADGDVEALIRGFEAEVRRVSPAGPYLIAGYSAGGLLAASLAGALQRQGASVRLVLLDSTLYSRRPTRSGLARWAILQARALLARRGLADRRGQLGLRVGRALGLSRSDRPPAWIPPSQMAFASRMIRTGASYRPEPFSGPTLMLVADDRDPVDALYDVDGLCGWSGVLTGPVERARTPGGHHQFMRPPNVGETAATVRRFLACGGAKPPAPHD